MEKCLIFGCGNNGEAIFEKLSELFHIIAWVDNNEELQGRSKYNVPIIAPSEMNSSKERVNAVVVISVNDYIDIVRQLEKMGRDNIIVCRRHLLYYLDEDRCLIPYKSNFKLNLKLNGKKNILFVQTEVCIRTHKIAKALKEYGCSVCLAYVIKAVCQSNSEYWEMYDGTIPIYSIEELIECINMNEFDYVHCSNEPDFLTMIATCANKTVIHDCHDLSSAYKSMTPEQMAIEYLANTSSNGVIYTAEGIRQVAREKYGLSDKKMFVLENLISNELKPTQRKNKLSLIDGQLHCVYEGGIIPEDKESHRFFETIWMRIAQEGIHIHFYTNCDKWYCEYLEKLNENIHYEGNKSSKELSNEMTQYDVGLCILNVTETNRQYLEYASPNKIQEYVNAGLPVAVGAVESQKAFVEKNGFGKKIDLSKNVKEQLEEVKLLEIEENILEKRGLTLESRIPELLKFYETCRKEA